MPIEPTAQTIATDARLITLAPLLYVAWADGLLSSEEIDGVRHALSQQDWLTAEAQRGLGAWLDPSSPPSAVELDKLLALIRRAAATLSAKQRRTLASLGLEIAEIEHATAARDFDSGAVHAALLEVEKALGIASPDAVKALLAAAPWPVEDDFDEPAPPFDKTAFSRLIEGGHHQDWQRVRVVLARPEFRLVAHDGAAEQRARVRSWLGVLAAEGLGAIAVPEAYGGRGDMRGFIASFEALAMFDLSLLVKFGVQFGLFGGSVQRLGTERVHQQHLAEIASGRELGGFAMTELGHGSNVREIETVARYDAARGVFVLDTPTESARKEFIGNAGEDGRFMTVFAQLEVGGQRHGVHALLVRIRADDGSPVTGVRTEDCGQKMGLNGVDNGRIWFERVEVPREQLLDRFGGVNAEGRYESPIASPSKRFFTMLGTLVGGRISVAAAANTAAKVALAIAIRYGALRRQFGPPGSAEKRILDYPEHQLRLFPRLAATLGIGFALQELTARFAAPGAEDDREIETLAAALKVLSTKNAIETVQLSRECCGGMGFLSLNRIAALRTDVDVFATFEGDNTVLLQLCAKTLLTDFRQQLSDDLVTTTLKLLSHRAAVTFTHKNPIGARRTERTHLLDQEFHHALFSGRHESLLTSAATRIKRRIDAGSSAFDAFNDVQDHLLSLASAFGERVIVERFAAAVAAAPAGAERTVLEQLYALYCLSRVRDDLAFFAENGFVEPAKARAIRKLIVTLCRELRPLAVPLVDAFAIPDNCLAAPIAFERYLENPAL